MLCALSYLHGQSPPIIHGNLTCDSVFIAHNGLIKIGAVAPDAIRQTVKSVCINGLNNMHTLAPELAGDITPAVGSSLPIVSSNGLAVSSPGASTVIGQACPATDIYAFGVVALEMALLGFASNTRSDSERLTSSASSPSLANSSSISPLPPSTLLQSNWSRESLLQMLQQLEMPLQREFISGCLSTDPHQRPTARSLLFHPLVFQVPSLQLLCAHRIISSDSPYSAPETLAEELQKRRRTSNKPVAQIPCINGQARSLTPTDLSRCNSEHVEQLVEEVRDGVHPMYAFEKRKLIRTCSSQLFEVSSQVSDGTHTTVRSSESRQSNVPDGTSDSRCRFDSMRSEQSIGVFYANSNQFETSLPQSDGAVALDAALYDSAESLSVAFETCTHCAEPTYTVESRRIVQIEVLVQHATAAATDNPHSQPMLSVRLRLDDQMNRQLSCELSELDSPMTMAQELVYYGFIHPVCLSKAIF